MVFQRYGCPQRYRYQQRLCALRELLVITLLGGDKSLLRVYIGVISQLLRRTAC